MRAARIPSDGLVGPLRPCAPNVPSPSRSAATLSRKRERVKPTRGFTLVELLVTVTIIAILATLVLGALHTARQAAREVKTKSTIAKLNGVIMDRYEAFRTRRVPLALYDPGTGISPATTAGLPPRLAAAVRLQALRQVMCMEMPERWSDLDENTFLPDPTAATPGTPLVDPRRPPPQNYQFMVPRTALSAAYLRRYNQCKADVEARYGVGLNRGQGTERLNRYSSAECLYMIVTMGAGPDVRGRFNESEIGDADDDGLPEFHDGWGNPILFLRWAPGLTESDLQTQTFNPSTGDFDLAAIQAADLEDHDPFDYMSLLRFKPSSPTAPFPYAYRLVPFIYSAGPDGVYDINFQPGYSFAHFGDPFSYADGASRVPNYAGAPVDSRNQSVTASDPPAPPDPAAGPKTTSNSLDHYDNLHNHRMKAD